MHITRKSIKETITIILVIISYSCILSFSTSKSESSISIMNKLKDLSNRAIIP